MVDGKWESKSEVGSRESGRLGIWRNGRLRGRLGDRDGDIRGISKEWGFYFISQ